MISGTSRFSNIEDLAKEYPRLSYITDNGYVFPEVADIDPYDKTLTIIQKAYVMKECMVNPGYFFRKVLRLPRYGVNKGIPFEFNRHSAAMLYNMIYGNKIIDVHCRQVGASTVVRAYYLWALKFCLNTNIGVISTCVEDEKLDINEMFEMNNLLPSYLHLGIEKTTYGLENTLNGNKAIRNSYITLDKSNTDDNFTYYENINFWMIDNFVYLSKEKVHNIDHFFIKSYNKYLENYCRKNDVACCFTIITTQRKIDKKKKKDPAIISAFNKYRESIQWDESMYGWGLDTLNRPRIYDIRLMGNGFISIKYDYKDIENDPKMYFDMMVNNFNKNWEKIREEVTLDLWDGNE